jgi:hypothetical protein
MLFYVTQLQLIAINIIHMILSGVNITMIAGVYIYVYFDQITKQINTFI